MRQYDVYRNPGPRTRKAMPYVLVLQSDLLSETEAVIVAALTPAISPSTSRLYPAFEIAGQAHTLLTPDMASIPRDALVTWVKSLADEWSRITAAIDILFTGV